MAEIGTSTFISGLGYLPTSLPRTAAPATGGGFNTTFGTITSGISSILLALGQSGIVGNSSVFNSTTGYQYGSQYTPQPQTSSLSSLLPIGILAVVGYVLLRPSKSKK